MRRMNLTANEIKLIHTVLNSGDQQRGLSLPEIRTLLPLVDKLEVNAKRRQLPDGEMLEFVDASFVFKESEYNTILTKMEASSGWVSVDFGRKVIALVDKLKEVVSDGDTDKSDAS